MRHKEHAPKHGMVRPFSAPKFNKTCFVPNQDPVHPGVFECVELENEFSYFWKPFLYLEFRILVFIVWGPYMVLKP